MNRIARNRCESIGGYAVAVLGLVFGAIGELQGIPLYPSNGGQSECFLSSVASFCCTGCVGAGISLVLEWSTPQPAR